MLVSTITGIFNSYRYKFVVFAATTGCAVYALWDVLSFEPSTITTGAINVNRLIFAQLLFLFPIAYAFLEREGIRRHLAAHASLENVEKVPAETQRARRQTTS